MYFKGVPLFPFGFGLSYTTFRYANLRVSVTELRPGGEIKVQVDVTKTGHRAGDEVVQVYVQHIGSKMSRPAQGLKAFRHITLQPEETKTVEMPIQSGALRYWSEGTGAWVLEKDQVEIRVGPSSAETFQGNAIRTPFGR